jgi:hypothetical protein
LWKNFAFETIAVMNEKPSKQEFKAYASDPYGELTIQDAMTLIAVQAAQLDPDDCEKDIHRIEWVLRKLALFREPQTDTRRRVNAFVNATAFKEAGHLTARAARVLNEAGAADTAFEAALEVAVMDGALTEKSSKVLGYIASLLTVPEERVAGLTAGVRP